MDIRMGCLSIGAVMVLSMSACTSGGGVYDGFSSSAVDGCENLSGSEQARCMDRSMSTGYSDHGGYWMDLRGYD